ncbi:MAG: CDP-alcohol phosphatidyltransferase family protein, partial [Oscillospiraceae bacterium]
MNFKSLKRELFSIPNILSYVRLLLIPVFIYVFYTATIEKNSTLYIVSTIIVIISGLTDWLDGYIARHYNMITQLGKVLDPFADKLTSITVVACLCFKFDFMIWLLILYIIKELTMIICGLFLIKKKVKIDGAKWFGKLATFVFYSTMIILVAINPSNSWANTFLIGCIIVNATL